MTNYNLRRPTIADAKLFGRRLGISILYSPEWKEFTVRVDPNNHNSDYFTADIIDAMQTADYYSRNIEEL